MSTQKRIPTWVVLLFGVLLGATLTYTISFHLWWCSSVTPNQGRTVGRNSLPFMPRLQPAQRGVEERCVCGEELRTLESAKDAMTEEEKPAQQEVQELINSSKPHPVAEGGAKINLVVSVASPSDRSEWLEVLFETWGKHADQLLMFVGEHFSRNDSLLHGLPVVPVSLSHTTGGSVFQGMLDYLIQHRLHQHTWFLLAQDNSYVRLPELEGFLARLDPTQPHYVGRWAKGRPSEVDRLGLKPHERYCLGISGIVLNSALLDKMKEPLKQCWSEAGDIPDDVILGKCISRHLDMQCTQDETVREIQSPIQHSHPFSSDQLPLLLSRRVQ